MKRGIIVFAVTLLAACGGGRPGTFNLTLVHLNDTHSHLEPTPVELTIDGVETGALLGGFARLKTVLDGMRAEDTNLLVLHGGDAVQGTLYFTLFNGTVEFDFLNLLGVDAMTFGNHEFDRGIAPIPGWIRRSAFPWLSATIDFSAEPAVAPLVKPYLIREVNGERVAVIGATTETTPQSTMDVGKALFRDAVESSRRQVAALTALGINKIILLSHLGYQQDKSLATQVAGIDVIVGGHSHTLLGDEERLSVVGLAPEGSYPTVMKAPDGTRVLVVQAWKWGWMLGRLKVDFTPEGEVSSYSSAAVIPVGERFTRNGAEVAPASDAYREIAGALNRTGTARIVAEDAAVAAALAPYAARLDQFRKEVVARAADDLPVGLNSGPGPLAADSMLAAVPGAQAAVLNYGAMRKSLMAGDITLGDVVEVMPFANTLVLADLTGAELKQALEEDIDFLISKYGLASHAMPYLGGAVMTVRPTAAKGARVTSLSIMGDRGVYQPVQPDKRYRIVVNAFIANGGDGFAAIRNGAGFRNDTGIIDSDAFRDYLKSKGTLSNPTEQRVIVDERTTLSLFAVDRAVRGVPALAA
jgi:5'-nucleotidase